MISVVANDAFSNVSIILWPVLFFSSVRKKEPPKKGGSFFPEVTFENIPDERPGITDSRLPAIPVAVPNYVGSTTIAPRDLPSGRGSKPFAAPGSDPGTTPPAPTRTSSHQVSPSAELGSAQRRLHHHRKCRCPAGELRGPQPESADEERSWRATSRCAGHAKIQDHRRH